MFSLVVFYIAYRAPSSIPSLLQTSKRVNMSEEDWGQMLEEQEKQQQEQQLSSKVRIEHKAASKSVSHTHTHLPTLVKKLEPVLN